MKNKISKPAMSDSKKYEDYEVKSWADTLMQAEEIKADPEKMKLLHPHLEKKSKAIKSLDDLRSKAKQVAADEME